MGTLFALLHPGVSFYGQVLNLCTASSVMVTDLSV